MAKDKWTNEQIKYLTEHIDSQTFDEIAQAIQKTPLAVQLYIHRKRIPVKVTVIRNLVQEVLTIKFVNPQYFQPNKDFFNAVQFTQKRWWNLYYGREAITEEEYIRLVDHFKVSLKDAFEARQLNLFDQQPNDRSANN